LNPSAGRDRKEVCAQAADDASKAVAKSEAAIL